MVDAGINYKQIKTKLEIKGIDLKKINAIFITHDHSDHVKGLNVLFKNNPHLKIYILKSTYEKIDSKYLNIDQVNFVMYDDKFFINNLNIDIIETSHDSNGSFGLIFKNHLDDKFVHITDTGYLSDINLSKIKGCNGILIESNYEDEVIIDNPKYPFMTKKRIMSEAGHLSNIQCNDYLKQIVTKKTSLILYAHLSENNNTPEIVLNYCDCFSCQQIILHPSEIVEVNDVK